MGVVYLAEDIKLDRPVALKFLPAHLLGDEDIRKRFEREAKAAAALDHPNVCHVYEIDEADGKTFLAMSLIEGESLDKLIAQGPLKLEDALDIAQQTAKGSEAAHKRGIVHRDIKPENLMVGEDGRVTIMDFGLAQLTEVSRLTRTDETLGTTAYMSPEQTEGGGTDQRTDIWSLGVVLYEMITGQQPFKGDYDKAVMYSILNEEPEPITSVRTGVPMQVEDCVNKCLAKDRENRYQSAAELIVDLRSLSEKSKSGHSRVMPPAGAQYAAPSTRLPWIIAAACAAIAVFTTALSFRDTTPAVDLSALEVSPLTAYRGVEKMPDLSADGEQVAFVWNGPDGANEDIYVRQVSGGRPLRLTEDPAPEFWPTWSPDGSKLAFRRGDSVFVIPPLGGPERRIATVGQLIGDMDGLAWSPDGARLVVPTTEGLLLVDEGTAATEQITTSVGFPDTWPAYSPDGRSLAFIRGSTGFLGAIFLAPVDSGGAPTADPSAITRAEWDVYGLDWLSGGTDLVFSAREGSRDLMWIAPSSGATPPRRLVIENASSQDVTVAGQASLLAYSRSGDDRDIWKLDLTKPRLGAERLVSSTQADNGMVVSPDGNQLAYISSSTGYREVWRTKENGSDALQLTRVETALLGSPKWSPDGDWIIFDIYFENSSDIYRVRSEGGDIVPVIAGDTNDTRPVYSPDGHWLYFSSDRSGRREIWKAQADGSDPIQLTHGEQAARNAVPTLDGKSLYFQRPSGVWKMPAEGGDEELVHRTRSPKNGNWIVGERNLYLADDESRAFVKIDLATSASSVILPYREDWSEISFGPALALAPDGSYLLFSMFHTPEADLVLVEGIE